MASSISAGTTSSTALVATADTTGILQLASNNGTVAVTVDTSQNVGIGTTSPSGKLQVTAAAGTETNFYLGNQTAGARTNIRVQSASNNDGYIFFERSGASENGYIRYSQSSDFMSFQTASAERMRIDGSGNVLVNNTSFSSGKFQLYQNAGGTSYAQQIFVEYASGTGYFIEFLRRNSGANNAVGTIQASTTNVSYNTSSDYRLKENIAPMTGALAKVALLKPVTYQWKIDGSDGEGFLAHELQEICPHAATGEKDGVDEKGNPRYQGIDTSFLVATLTAAIQELTAKVTALEEQVLNLGVK
jgi:hypothetical protein